MNIQKQKKILVKLIKDKKLKQQIIYMMVNGKPVMKHDKVKDTVYGKMERLMKDIGKMTSLMGMVE